MESISHPRISRLYEAVETPKRMHLIMECLDGGNLCSYVKAKRRLSEDEARKIFVQVGDHSVHLSVADLVMFIGCNNLFADSPINRLPAQRPVRGTPRC